MGVGGGILFVPALTLLLDQSQLDAEATSLLAIIPVAVVGAWRQHGYGNVRLRDGLAIGVLSAGRRGGRRGLANNVPERALEIGFACLLLFVARSLCGARFSQPAPLQDLTNRLERPLDPGRVHVEMRHGAQPLRRRAARAGRPRSQSGRAGRERVVDLEDHDVGLDRGRIDRDAVELGQPVGEPARVGVVLGEPLDVVVERAAARRPRDPGLAHRAAHHLLVAPGLVDQRRASAASTAPTGAPRPLVKSIQAVSNPRA